MRRAVSICHDRDSSGAWGQKISWEATSCCRNNLLSFLSMPEVGREKIRRGGQQKRANCLFEGHGDKGWLRALSACPGQRAL